MSHDMTSLPVDLQKPLRGLKRRRLFLSALKWIGVGLFVFVIGAIVTGWTDLIVALPAQARLVLVVGLLSAAMVLLLYGVVVAINRCRPTDLAWALDRVGKTGGQIRAGVELVLAMGAAKVAPQTEDLTRRAVKLSSELAARQDRASAQPATPAFRPYVAVVCAIAFVGAAWLIWPGLVEVQAARVFDPLGNHEQPSPYTFRVEAPVAVTYGDAFEIVVRIEGADARERFEWVVEQPDRKPWRFPLIARAEDSYAGALSAVLNPFSYHIVGPRGRSKSFHVAVINTPKIVDSAVRLVFPAYTGLSPFEGPLPEGGPAGVRGTKVTLLIESNRPLSGGQIQLWPSNGKGLGKSDRADTEAKVVSMKPVDPKNPCVVSGTFEITSDLRFAARISDVGGLASKETLDGRCLLIPDHPPTISMIQPRPLSFATSDIALPVVLEVEDDFGFSEIVLYRSLNGSRASPMQIPFEKNLGPRLQRELWLPLSEWALDPGDLIELHALVRDNDPAGAKTAETRVHRITIISREQYRELARQQETIDDLYNRYKPWLKKLADLRDLWAKTEGGKNPKALEKARQALREALEELEEQLKDPPVFDADQIFSEELRRLQQTLKQAMEDLEDGNYAGVDNRLGQGEEDFQRDLDMPLELLTKLYRLIEDEALYTVLAQIQEDLARRLKRFADKENVEDPKDQQDLRSLLDEQREVRSALQRVLQDIRDHAGQLPKDDERLRGLIDSADKFVTEAHDMGIDKELEKCEKALGENQGKSGAEHARKAAEMMMSLVERGGDGLAQGAMGQIGRFAPRLSSTVNQMLSGRGLPRLGSRGFQGGGGFTMGRGSNSVGLYGNKRQRRSGGGRGDKKQKAQGANFAFGESLKDAKGFGVKRLFDQSGTSGVPLSALPSFYRSAVRDYYRRVADELAGAR